LRNITAPPPQTRGYNLVKCTWSRCKRPRNKWSLRCIMFVVIVIQQ